MNKSWEILVTVILALIGGGIVNIFIESIKNNKKNKALKTLLFTEIEMNLKILEMKYLVDNPWVRHKIFNQFYEKHFLSVTDIDLSKATVEKIATYYNIMEVLKEKDKENIQLESLYEKGRLEGADFVQKDLSKAKKNLRIQLIELSKQILENK